MSEIQEKQPYVFNHETEGVHDGIGIPEPRFDEIIDTAEEAYRKSSNTVQAMEYAMNKINPTIVEALAIGYSIGIIHEKVGAALADNPIASLLQQMRRGG